MSTNAEVSGTFDMIINCTLSRKKTSKMASK